MRGRRCRARLRPESQRRFWLSALRSELSGLLFVYDYTAGSPHLITFSSPANAAAPGIWFLDNFGQDLLAVLRTGQTPIGSTIYLWVPAPGLSGFAMPLTNGPPAANGVIVNSTAQQVIAWGVPVPDPNTSTWGTIQDPMLIAWTDNSDPTAGSHRRLTPPAPSVLLKGRRFSRSVAAQGQMLVHTDAALYGMQFIGSPFIYGFQQLGTNCGSIAPKAATTIGWRVLLVGIKRTVLHLQWRRGADSVPHPFALP